MAQMTNRQSTLKSLTAKQRKRKPLSDKPKQPTFVIDGVRVKGNPESCTNMHNWVASSWLQKQAREMNLRCDDYLPGLRKYLAELDEWHARQRRQG
jgi:hypothetical protein